jgi:hypothetical protein
VPAVLILFEAIVPVLHTSRTVFIQLMSAPCSETENRTHDADSCGSIWQDVLVYAPAVLIFFEAIVPLFVRHKIREELDAARQDPIAFKHQIPQGKAVQSFAGAANYHHLCQMPTYGTSWVPYHRSSLLMHTK